jgi:hypothetical protein
MKLLCPYRTLNYKTSMPLPDFKVITLTIVQKFNRLTAARRCDSCKRNAAIVLLRAVDLSVG